jgi:hypothetical protein
MRKQMSKLNIPLLGVQYDILIPYILQYTLYFYVFHPIGKLEKHPMGLEPTTSLSTVFFGGIKSQINQSSLAYKYYIKFNDRTEDWKVETYSNILY